MSVQLPHLSSMRLAALAVALMLGAGFAAAKPAIADAVEWQRQQPHWTQQSNGWQRQWPNQSHRNQFNNRSQVIIIPGPGFGVGNGFIVRQPGFIVGQPGIIVRRPNFIFERPSFAKKQWQFINRHPSLQVGKPWWRKNWKQGQWQHNKRWMNNTWRGNGMRFTTPGMRFTTPGMRFTTP